MEPIYDWLYDWLYDWRAEPLLRSWWLRTSRYGCWSG